MRPRISLDPVSNLISKYVARNPKKEGGAAPLRDSSPRSDPGSKTRLSQE